MRSRERTVDARAPLAFEPSDFIEAVSLSAAAEKSPRARRLFRFVEMARGMGDRVDVRLKEVVRDALQWHAEQVLCARSDPLGDHQPTVHDVEDARRVKRALDLLEMPLLDYVIVGESITSLVHRRVI
jgi:DNA repair protein RadC